MATNLLDGEQRVSATEKRFLAPLPEITGDSASWARLPGDLEAWHDDHLGMRDAMIRTWAFLTIRLFGVSPTDKLVVGRQGWLFYGDRDAIRQYRGVAPLGDRALARWTRVLEERRDWLAARGIAFLLVLVPDKHIVYGEYMPDSLPRSEGARALEQLAGHLRLHSTVPVLDLRAAIEAAKAEARIYHRTDSHWNDLGAYAAYRAILRKLGETVPALAAAEPVAVGRNERDAPGMGLASIVGLQSILREQVLEAPALRARSRIKPEHRSGYERRVERLLPIAHGVDDPALPRAVMFRDSFANALIPYLSENFSRILYVWNRDVDPRVGTIEQPDVVIQEVVGRFLVRPPRGIAELAREGAPSQR
jgi:hypothetical protein